MQKKVFEIKLALLDEILDLNRQAGSDRVIQKFMMDAIKSLEKSITQNKQAIQKAEQGLKAAQQLGEQSAVDTFKRWISNISQDIKETERQLSQVKNVDIGF